MSTEPLEADQRRYWKAAISHLPTQQQRDAAWEFYLSRFAGNPQTADTISGTVMVMEAHGLYMLAFPRKFREEAVIPLEGLFRTLLESTEKLVSQQSEANAATVAAWEKAEQTAQDATSAVNKLDNAIHEGWREVNTEKLAERIHMELEETLLQPLAAQCRQLQETTPSVKDSIDQLVQSARKLRVFHFRGIILALSISSFAIVGTSLWKLNKDFDFKIKTALHALHETSTLNREAYQKLDALGAKIRIITAKDDRGKPVADHYALVMDAGYDVIVRDSPKGKQAGIFFRSVDLEQRTQQFLKSQQ